MFRQKKEAEEKRKSALQSGYAKPNSFNDFMLMHDDYVGGDQYFANPLLKPNNRVYLFSIGGIDRQDGNNLIIKSTTGYIFVRTNHSTPMFGVLQVHSPTVVLGRYVDNTQYTTVLGEIRTAPVIEAIAVTKAQY